MAKNPALLAPILIFIALSCDLHSDCPSSSSQIFLAAVTGENSGGVFSLRATTQSGNGTIYTSVSPRTGYSTQESEEIATKYAFYSTGIDQGGCDVLFEIEGADGSDSVDGPSAGAAMAVAVRAALLNKSIRQDVVMTGTISPDGRVGEVGGIIEKSEGAIRAGATYMLVPSLKIHEALLLSSASKGRRFFALEVSSVEEAEKILFSPYSSEFQGELNPESRPIPIGLQPMAMDAELGRFTLVAKKVVDTLEDKVAGALAGQDEPATPALRRYFSDEVAKYRSLLAMGYPFTAANAAFLLSIDAEYLKIGDAEIDLDGSIEDVGNCVEGLSPPAKTVENFHWAVGSDLRRIWAREKLNETLELRHEQGGYATLRDLLFSYSWCGISKELALQAESVAGKKVDEAALYNLAQEKITDAEVEFESARREDYDAWWHLENAYAANESGDFGAAIYEATYAKTMQALSNDNAKNTTEAAQKLLQDSRTSLWGKIYYGQGAYLLSDAAEGNSAPTDAHRILRYSQELDRAAAEIDEELLKVASVSVPEQDLPQDETAGQGDGHGRYFALGLLLAGIALWIAAAKGLEFAGGKKR